MIRSDQGRSFFGEDNDRDDEMGAQEEQGLLSKVRSYITPKVIWAGIDSIFFTAGQLMVLWLFTRRYIQIP
jgi:hypothetical protein